MGAYKDFKTSKKVEMEGVWLDYGDYKILIARAGGGNKAYDRCLENKTKPYRKVIQNEIMPIDRQEQILMEVYIETVILDWEGMTDEKDKELKFTKDNVRKVLTDLPELWRDILQQSTKTALFRENIREAEAKN